MKFVTLSLLATALTVGGNAAEQARSSKQPNILFILADDFGWRDLACTGSRYYESPNIDGIARNGVRFTQGYAACQVSSPSRASIMTGKFTARSGRSRALLPSSPLRTVREGFPSYGSSFSKSLFVCRDRLILLLVSIVFTG